MNKFISLLLLIGLIITGAVLKLNLKQKEVTQTSLNTITDNTRLQIYHFNNPQLLKDSNRSSGQAFSDAIESQSEDGNYNTSSAQSTSATLVDPYLLTDIWGGVNCINQDSATVYPLNYFTPNHYSAGCVAICMSQVLNYWEWPKTGVGSHTYTDNYGSSQKTYSVDFSKQTYAYDLMLDNYYLLPSTDAQRRAVGYLAYHCAVSLNMDFESTGSTSNVDKQPAALNNHFRFSGHYQTRYWSSFWTRMKENLADGMPVLLSIKDVDGGGAGHALVADAYRTSDGKFHLNWGWHGRNNGWYDIQYAWNGTGGGYDRVEGAVFDILPDPEISEITRSSSEKDFTLKWVVSDKLNWDSFAVEQSVDGGAWSEIANNISTTQLAISVANAGTYNYRVRAKVNGVYYYNSYSVSKSVFVKDDIVSLEFDGDDSFFVKDNTSNDLDINSDYTIETWFNVASHATSTYPVLLDRKTVFSLYVITDSNTSSDYALRFVARNSSGSIIASLRTDNSSASLNFGDWHHVAISRQSGTAKLFIDGNLIQSSTDYDFNLTASSNALNIGARYWGSYSRFLDGKLDGISVSKTGKYSSNFSPDIITDYTVDANTVLYLNLNEGTGTSIGDSAGNFTGIVLRSSPNLANWIFESYSAPMAKTLAEVSFDNENKLSIYPTVIKNRLNIRSSFNETVDYNYSIYNSMGQVVLSGNGSISRNEVNSISFDVVSNGVYIMKFESNSYSTTERVMVRH